MDDTGEKIGESFLFPGSETFFFGAILASELLVASL